MRPARPALVRLVAALVAGGPAAAPAQATPDAGMALLAPVATRRLPRGTVLREGDFRLTRVVARGTPSAVAPGWITRRVIDSGEVLRAPAVAPRPLVAAGQPVHYIVAGGGIRLTMDGRAISAAALGERISVRLGANRRVEGIVTGAAEVTAPDSTRSS